MSRDPFPKSTEFSGDDYVVLVAHPAPFQKFLEPFLCLIRMSQNYTLDEDTYPTFLHDDGTEMDLFAFIQVVDPTKVKVGEREHAKEEARLLDSIVGHVVPLLPVTSARAESELEASMERLFDEGGGADHGDFAAGGGHGAETESTTGVRIIVAKNMTAERPKARARRGKLLQMLVSPSALKELLASNMLNVEAGVAAVATLPMVTSSVSATPKHESGPPTDYITGLNLCTLGLTERFVISSDSSHHSNTNASKAGIDSFLRSMTPPPVMTEVVITTNVAIIPSAPTLETGTRVVTPVHALMFHDSYSTRMVKSAAAGSSHVPGKELSLGSREVDYENLHEVFVPRWNVSNDALLDDFDTSREFIDHLAHPILFAQICDMDYEELFTDFNVGTSCQACLSVEVRMQTEYCLSERKRLESECVRQADLLKSRDKEVENLKAQLLLKETEAAEAARLRAQVSAFEAAERVHVDELNILRHKNMALEDERNSLNGKVTELQSLVFAKDCELEDVDVTVASFKFHNDGLVNQVHVLEATCSGLHEWLSRYENLTERLEEFQDAQLKVINDKVVKLDADLAKMACHLEEKFYPHLLTTISGRRWLLNHGLKLVLVKCLHSSEYLTSLGVAISRAIEKGMHDGLAAGIDHGREGRSLTDVVAYNPSAEADFNSALQELHKIDFPLLAELKSHKDASVEGIMNLLCLEGPLADAPSMGDLQPDIEQLKVPIHRSEDQVVLGETSLSFALSVSHSRVEQIRANIAAECVPAATVTTTALSTTFASASSIPPITVDDYEIVHADGQESSQGNVQGDAATVEFEKEDLDTTLERDLLS
ncbi:hypothetical protein Tco_0163927 [Tanacetum coccineum]